MANALSPLFTENGPSKTAFERFVKRGQMIPFSTLSSISIIPSTVLVFDLYLTHYQTTNFGLFQAERVCRQQFQI